MHNVRVNQKIVTSNTHLDLNFNIIQEFKWIVISELQINPIDIDGTHNFLFFYVSNIEIPPKGTLDNPAGTTSRVV